MCPSTLKKDLLSPEEIMAAALNSANTGIAIFDEDFQLEYHNTAVNRLLDLSPESQLNAVQILEEIELDNRQLIRISKSVKKSSSWQGNYFRNGSIFNISFKSFATETGARASSKLLLEISNATRDFDLPKQFSDSSQVIQFDKLKNDFFNQITHELRTPLNAILGFTQLLCAEQETYSKHHDSLDEIMHASNKLLSFINDIITYSRETTNSLILHQEKIDLEVMFADCQELMSPLAAMHGVSMSYTVGVKTVISDRLKLKSILLNILGNAIKYNHKGGKVFLKSYKVKGKVRLQVADTGKGINPSEQVQLLDPFQALSSNTRSLDGKGLGLMISRRLAKYMGSRLELASYPQCGSIFWFDLPTKEEHEVVTTEGSDNRKHHLFLIDSDPSAAAFCRQLSQLGHFSSYTCLNTRETRVSTQISAADDTTVIQVLRNENSTGEIPQHFRPKGAMPLKSEGFFVVGTSQSAIEFLLRGKASADLVPFDILDMPELSDVLVRQKQDW